MKIKLIKGPHEIITEVDAESGITAEELAGRYQSGLPYKVLAVTIDNKLEDLSYVIDRPCAVELLDMRSRAAKLIYENSLVMIYLKAIEETVGRVQVDVPNSLGKTLYTEIRTKEPLTDEMLGRIEKRMHEIVDADIPFEKETADREHAFEMLEKADLHEKKRMLEHAPDVRQVKYYSLDGFTNFFYGVMVPSSGYIDKFALQKYRRGVLLRYPRSADPSRLPDFEDEKKLYAAFGENKKWEKILGVSYVTDLNEKIGAGQEKTIIQLSEALHEKRIVEIADEILKKNRRLVLIAGPSSSGKTTFAKRLCIQLAVAGTYPLYMGTDDYFLEREQTPLDENGEKDYESFESLDTELFNDHMNRLIRGETVDLPTFDFLEGRKKYGRKTALKSGAPIVIEGIHALNVRLTAQVEDSKKYKIYISPLTQLAIDCHNRVPITDARLIRRIVRDNKYRGHSAADTIKSWNKVRDGEEKNIFPYTGEADVFFNSAHAYELCVLKQFAYPLLAEIPRSDEAYSEAVRLMRFLDFFKVIDADLIANDSLLREFIGGSIFVD